MVWQVEEDRKHLERLIGKSVCCMAYPCGGVNNDERVEKLLRRDTKIRFARTITPSHSFDLQENLLRFNPTLHWNDSLLFNKAEEFLSLQAEEPKLFYIWGIQMKWMFRMVLGKGLKNFVK